VPVYPLAVDAARALTRFFDTWLEDILPKQHHLCPLGRRLSRVRRLELKAAPRAGLLPCDRVLAAECRCQGCSSSTVWAHAREPNVTTRIALIICSSCVQTRCNLPDLSPLERLDAARARRVILKIVIACALLGNSKLPFELQDDFEPLRSVCPSIWPHALLLAMGPAPRRAQQRALSQSRVSVLRHSTGLTYTIDSARGSSLAPFAATTQPRAPPPFEAPADALDVEASFPIPRRRASTGERLAPRVAGGNEHKDEALDKAVLVGDEPDDRRGNSGPLDAARRAFTRVSSSGVPGKLLLAEESGRSAVLKNSRFLGFT
jgi:hypothetical protein